MNETTEPHPTGTRRSRFLYRAVLPLLVVAVGFGISHYLMSTRPRAERESPEPAKTLVRAVRIAPARQQVTVHAMGTVVPSREIVLRSRVGGEIVEVAPEFIEGGLLDRGQVVLKIDPVDYELALARAESELANAEYELELEHGRQQVARREWELLDTGQTPVTRSEEDLALRRPHLARIEAAVRAARANLEQARLDLARTEVRAPFNAVILERGAELGAQVSTQDPLATLVDTDAFWVRVSVPVDRLRWLTVPVSPGEPGSPAHIRRGTPPEGAEWIGRVIRLLGDLEEKGRMARLLLRIEDPFGLRAGDSSNAPLLLRTYVRVDLDGGEVEHAVRVPRSALRDGSRVWLATTDDTLDIRQVEVVWREPETVLIHNSLHAGERLIVSDLAAPVQGMPLVVHGGRDPAMEPDQEPVDGG